MRPSFRVATAVVAVLGILGIASRSLQPLVPTQVRNGIGAYPGDFLKQGETLLIDWRPATATAFAEARRLSRPILLVIGTSWDQEGRDMDASVFSAGEVQNFIARNYIAVRVDADQTPWWSNGYLPLRRSETGARTTFQMWVLNPDGSLLAYLGRRAASHRWDRNNFLEELIRSLRLMRAVAKASTPSDLSFAHSEDLQEIRSPAGSSTPDFDAFSSSLMNRLDSQHGGLPRMGLQEPQPHAWRFLAMTGQIAALEAVASGPLHSPLVDVMDGGFFTRSRRPDFGWVETDKPLLLNAELALALQVMRTAKQRATVDGYLADRTVQSLTALRGELLPCALKGDLAASGRSERSSVPPERLRRVFMESDQREWVRNALGLADRSNRQMLPRLPREPLDFRRLEPALDQLRSSAPREREPTGGRFMSVNGRVAARLIEVGRMRADPSAVSFGTSLLDRIERYRSGDQVPHDLDSPSRSAAGLLDYLGYADACLQDYLASGRVVSLERGTDVLMRALEVFQGPTPGEYRLAAPEAGLPPDVLHPQLLDSPTESATAMIIRICSSYGRLLLGQDDDPALILLRSAFSASSLFSDLAPVLGVDVASYACATASVRDDAFAIAVGPDAQSLADELFHLRPTRLVAPAFGPVRRDLQSAKPGLYVIRFGEASGPYSVAQAAEALPLFLDVGTSRS